MTPLERAARALRLADSCDFHEAENKDYAGMVRAVLTAIREPSLRTLGAGRDAVEDYNPEAYDSPSAQVTAERTWQAMIDAALAEGE